MKTKFLLLFLLTILLQMNASSFAREMKSVRQIELRTRSHAEHRSIPIIPVAVIENTLLSVDFLSTVPVVILVKNAETDEVIYLSTDLDVENIYVDFAGEAKGKYILEIKLPMETYIGEFELD